MRHEETANTKLLTSTSGSGIIQTDRVVPTLERKEDVQHPSRVWVDPSYANERLAQLSEYFVEYLKGRSKPAAPSTIEKYSYSLQTFVRSLERHGEPVTLASLTPFAVNRWIAEQRRSNLAEDGIASRLASVKTFSRQYVYKHLELTTCDLLEKVARITPPEKPFPRLTEGEVERIMQCFDRGTYEDVRDKAIIATFLATGRRFREIFYLTLADINTISGEMRVRAKGGDVQMAVVSPRALKAIKHYLRQRPSQPGEQALWLTEAGTPFTYWGAQAMFYRLKKRSGVQRLHPHLLRHNFAQNALLKGAERAAVQEMLGHKTEAMTRRYTASVRQSSAARLMPKFSPY